MKITIKRNAYESGTASRTGDMEVKDPDPDAGPDEDEDPETEETE